MWWGSLDSPRLNMKRDCHLMILLVMLPLLGAGAGVAWWASAEPSTASPNPQQSWRSTFRAFTKEDFSRIRLGMTEKEVETILGGWHNDRADFEGLADCYLWTVGPGIVGIQFDDQHMVIGKAARWLE
jgi:hypothetical protein